jgi:peroxiredoxin
VRPAQPKQPEFPEGVGLEVGKHAPEIEGEDLDVKEFKLSDYRGKVVLLDFWGHW